jgi:outer membrane protein assembly factor BamE (lipoprotein component of BamABCDE complex)
MKVALFRISTAVGAALLLSGCAGILAHKGAVLDPQLASSIQPGIDNKASVEKLLGRPSFTGPFTPDDWYYVSRDTKQVGVRNPRVLRQTTLHVRFDQAGNVASIDRSGKELVASIDPSSRTTPTLGRKRSFFDELFGNIGTIGAPGRPGSGGY